MRINKTCLGKLSAWITLRIQIQRKRIKFDYAKLLYIKIYNRKCIHVFY